MVAVAFGATNPHWDRVKRKTKAVMVRRLEQTEADWDPDYDSGQEPPAYDRHCGRVLSWTQRINERGRPEPKQRFRGGPNGRVWERIDTAITQPLPDAEHRALLDEVTEEMKRMRTSVEAETLELHKGERAWPKWREEKPAAGDPPVVFPFFEHYDMDNGLDWERIF